jgi:phospholipid/cholesterol/gamma-HCH transport system substrate-binding protein
VLVGIFVVIGILLFGWMTVKIEKIQIKERGVLFNTTFDSATGLDRSSPVRVAGIHIGNVDGLALEGGKAKITFHVPKDFPLYKDAKAFIRSEGFLGEKYVEIFPGTPGQPRLEANATVQQGAPPVDMEQFLSQVGALRDDVKEVTKPLGDVLKAVDAKKVDGILSNLSTFSGQLNGLGKEAGQAIQKAGTALSRFEEVGTKLAKGEGTLGKLIHDDSVYEEAKKTIETARETVGTVKNAADSLKSVAEKIDRGEGTLGRLVQDESLYRDAKETIRSAKQTMESANEALKSVKEIATKIEKGEGTLGKLVNDETLVKEAEKTLKKVQKASEAIEEQAPITILGTIIGIFF